MGLNSALGLSSSSGLRSESELAVNIGFLGKPSDFGTGTSLNCEQRANRSRLAADLGRPCLWMDQRHGTDITRWDPSHVDTGRDGGAGCGDGLAAADIAIVTCSRAQAVSGVPPAACVVTADCLPIVMWGETGEDKENVSWAAVHAGRVGLEKGIIGTALAAMAQAGVTDVRAAVGPAICVDCYQVDTKTAANWSPEDVAVGNNLNLVGRAVRELSAGARVEAVIGSCTLHTSGWHSHRKSADGRRNAAYIWVGNPDTRLMSTGTRADSPGDGDMPGVSATLRYCLT